MTGGPAAKMARPERAARHFFLFFCPLLGPAVPVHAPRDAATLAKRCSSLCSSRRSLSSSTLLRPSPPRQVMARPRPSGRGRGGRKKRGKSYRRPMAALSSRAYGRADGHGGILDYGEPGRGGESEGGNFEGPDGLAAADGVPARL